MLQHITKSLAFTNHQMLLQRNLLLAYYYYYYGLYLPRLWKSGDGDIAKTHHDGKKRVQVLIIFAAVCHNKNSNSIITG